MPPTKRKRPIRAAAQQHSLIRRQAAQSAEPEEESVPLAPTALDRPTTGVDVPPAPAMPPISAIVAELLQQMKAEGLVLRGQPTELVNNMAVPTTAVAAVQQGINLPTLEEPSPIQHRHTGPPTAAAGSAAQLQQARPSNEQSGTHLMDQAIMDITGTPARMPISSISRPLDVHVDIRIKQKIWLGQYVEFGSLLTNKSSEQFDITIHANTLALIPKAKPVAIKSMEQWTSAFQIFVTILTQTNPELAGPLMKHANTVQHISRKAGDQAAIAYDVTFRKWKQDAPQLRYDEINQELFLEAMTSNISRKGHGGSHQSGQQSGQSRDKVCFAFQRKGVCNRQHCSFKHVCKSCGGPHSFRKCSKTDAQAATTGNGSNKPFPANKTKST